MAETTTIFTLIINILNYISYLILLKMYECRIIIIKIYNDIQTIGKIK